jgi:hypothetical protein
MTNSPIPWNTGRSRRGRAGPDWPRVAAFGALALAAVVFGWFAIRFLTGESCDDPYCPVSIDTSTPTGFALASDVYEYSGEPLDIPEGGGVDITVELQDDADVSSGLSFFQYRQESSSWEPLGAAVVGSESRFATGRFSDTPAIIAVMRRLSPAGNVIAYLDPGESLHPDAMALVTIVHTRDFRPAPDGTIEGTVSPPPATTDAMHIPSVAAGNVETGTLANLDSILLDASKRSAHVRAITTFVQNAGLPGIDISYMDLRNDQRNSFALFIAELATALHTDSKLLTVTLPPPTRNGDVVNEGSYDWSAIGSAADIVQMLPVRDQTTYRDDMTAILNYLSPRVAPSKLALVVTPLAAEKSQTGVRALTLTDAMTVATKLRLSGAELAPNENVEIVGFNIDQNEELTGLIWSANTATVAFNYKLDGARTVWLENVFSVGFKLEFATEWGLGGIAVEKASSDPFLGNIWPAIQPYVVSGQPLLLQPNASDLQPVWSAEEGLLEGGQRGVVRWTAPAEPGAYTVNLSLSDGVVTFESEIRLAVEQREDSGDG